MGSSKTTRLTSPLGTWLPVHDSHRYWHWRMHDSSHLVFRHSLESPTRVALPTMIRRTSIKFSPTVPTTIEFKGPPITPYDPNICYIHLPVVDIHHPKPPPTILPEIDKIQSQFWSQLLEWQLPIFCSLQKSYQTNTLYSWLCEGNSIIIVSDDLVQKSGASGFAWVIAQQATPLWHGLGLAPGPASNMYSG